MESYVRKNLTLTERQCIYNSVLCTRYGLNQFWQALSVNRDRFDLEYISTIEVEDVVGGYRRKTERP